MSTPQNEPEPEAHRAQHIALDVDAHTFPADRAAFPAQSSVLDEVALLERVVKSYAIPAPQSCRYLYRGDSDVYRVRAASSNYYLKIYRPRRPLAQAEGEARLVNDLADRELPVVRALALKNGGFAQEILAGEGRRVALLFEEAPPPLPKIWDSAIASDLGATVAQLHQIADNLDADYALPSQPLGGTLRESYPSLPTYLGDSGAAYVQSILDQLIRHFASQPRKKPAWGICHADLAQVNIRAGMPPPLMRGVSLFDFGAAAFSWRSYDLWRIHQALGDKSLRQTFLQAYQATRPAPPNLPKDYALYRVGAEIWNLGYSVENLRLRLGTNPMETGEIHMTTDRVKKAVEQAATHWPDLFAPTTPHPR